MSYRHHLMELTMLNGIYFQRFSQTSQSIYDYTIYRKMMFSKPINALYIIGYRFISDVIVS